MEKDQSRNIPVASSLYERVGGAQFFTTLVERFYESVQKDPVLRPISPQDLEPGKAHLAAFLAQFFGGPQKYSEERGAPRLRMRHASFAISQHVRDAWVQHMTATVEASEASARDRAELNTYFEQTATFLMNRPG